MAKARARFTKRIRLAKFVTLNIGLKGVSLSLGIPGLGINVKPGGKPTWHAGLPGTGASVGGEFELPIVETKAS